MIAPGLSLAEMERQLEASASSLDEIMRVLRRLPFTPNEGMYASQIIAKWQAEGRDVAQAPLSREYQALDPQERHAVRVGALKDGLMFVSSGDHGVEMVVVKVDAGRGLFGSQKVQYPGFIRMVGEFSYQPIGVAKTLTGAIIKMSNLYRS